MTETEATYTTDIEPAAKSRRARLLAIAAEIDAMEGRAQELRRQMAELEQAGMTKATIFWDKDRRGEKSIMKLIHPTDPATGERVREYVGKDPAKQALAQARLDRWREYINLEHELSKTEGQIASLDRLISGMETAAFGRQ